MQNDKFGQSGLQKYKQPTKVFCLIENWEEYFSEIKSSSNLKKFYQFERKRFVRNFFATSTIKNLSRVQSSMIELFVFIVICTCTAMGYSEILPLLFSP